MSAVDDFDAIETTGQKVPLNNAQGESESPRKKRRVGITHAQKQALIDNLQLESESLTCAWPPHLNANIRQ